MKYQIWNKKDKVYTPSGAEFTAEEWMVKYKWTKIPGVKCVLLASVFNGGFIAEFEQFRNHYMADGAPITADMSDEEVLAEAEKWDCREVEADPTAEERIAAALEFQNLNSLEE